MPTKEFFKPSDPRDPVFSGQTVLFENNLRWRIDPVTKERVLQQRCKIFAGRGNGPATQRDEWMDVPEYDPTGEIG